MNKKYVKPSLKVIKIQYQYNILGTASQGTSFYTVETKSASSAMSRQSDSWDDEE